MQRTESSQNNHGKIFGGVTLFDFKLNMSLLFKIMWH